MTLELRCQNNRKAGEIDPVSQALTFKCRTCSDVQGRPVFHHWPLWRILRALSIGQVEGVVFPSEDDLRPQADVH